MNRLLPSWLTGHRTVLLALVLLLAAAFVAAGVDDEFVAVPGDLAVSAALALVTCYLVSALGGLLVRVPPGADSWAITALILVFVMPPAADTATTVSLVIACAAGCASKYVLAWRRRLIVNPAVAGAVTAYALAYAGVGEVTFPTWWIASEQLLWPMAVIGAIVVTVLRRWPLALAFLATALVTMWIVRETADGGEISMWLQSSPLFFVAAIMLPEPLTAPPTRGLRMLYGAGVGALMYCQQAVEVSDAYTLEFVPEIALLIGSLFTFAVRLGDGSARRSRLTVTAVESTADRTHLVRTVPAGSAPRFRPGQWATVSAPTWSAPLWQRSRRVFSFANAPGQAPEFSFTASDPASPWKAGLITGRTTALLLDDIGGDFVPHGRAGAATVMIASGIGITPMLSMVRAAGESGQLAGITLIHVLRATGREVYGDDLRLAREAGAEVHVLIAPELAAGTDGFEQLHQLIGEPSPGAHYYLSGTPAFVDAAAAAVRRLDPTLRRNPLRLHRDSFLGY